MEYILAAILTLGAAGKLEAQQQKSPGENFKFCLIFKTHVYSLQDHVVS